MRWRGRRKSANVEDRRGERSAGIPFPFPGRRGGGGFRIPTGSGGRRGGGIGIMGILIIFGLMLLFGIDPRVILQGGMPGGGQSPGGSRPEINMPELPRFDAPGQRKTPGRQAQLPKASQPGREAPSDELQKFISVVLADTEDVWNEQFRRMGRKYQEPKLILFSGAVRSGCGLGQSAMGPFYCPLDQKVYVDLSFYEELRNRFRAPGDFAQAYVIAHEVGHHVQTLLGIAEKVQQVKTRMGPKQANQVQVMMELQADCFAGVWAFHADRTKGILESGDIEEALNAASAIGDDRIQKQTTGRVVPDSFTHGSAEQRVRWFKKGIQSGDLQVCDTFNAQRL